VKHVKGYKTGLQSYPQTNLEMQ